MADVKKTVTCFNGPMLSGKTAIPKLLKMVVPDFSIPSVGVGDLLRDSQKKGVLNKEYSDKMNQGFLLDSEFIWNFIEPHFPKTSGFFLDGFPRRVEQIDMILKWCQKNNFSMVYFNITQSGPKTVQRLNKINKTNPDRADRISDIFHTRWTQYISLTAPVVEKLKEIKDGDIYGYDVPIEIINFNSDQIRNFLELFSVYKSAAK